MRNSPQLSPDVLMAKIRQDSGAARGNGWAARFLEQGKFGDFPALAPLVRAMATLRVGPSLLES